jgi:hypothetical protein
VLVLMEGVRPDGTVSCIDHVGGSPVGRAGVNGGSGQTAVLKMQEGVQSDMHGVNEGSHAT